MKHSDLDALDKFLYKGERKNDTPQDLGEWQKTTSPPRQGEEKTTSDASST
tara:strand:+ start:202 stop:354 length:153 start_codon:yes stop_codon:yes gene_type:complete